MESTARPFAVANGAGHRFAMRGAEFEVKATADQTAGVFGLIESEQVGGVPTHVHLETDESFFVLEGEYVITAGDDRYVAGPGSFVFIPRGTPHAQEVDRGRKLILLTPGGFEQWFIDRAEHGDSWSEEESAAFDRQHGLVWQR